MTRPYSQDIVEEAARLYIQEGLSLREIADGDSGFNITTLRRWADKYDWEKMRRRRLRKEGELEQLLSRIKLCLARMVLSEDNRSIDENIDSKQVYAVCRAVAVLSPPTSVLLRQMDMEENEQEDDSVEDRMAKVRELLKGAGFVLEHAHKS